MFQNKIASCFTGGARISTAILRDIAQKHKLYVVFLTARSGSSWLIDLAKSTGTLGCPQEWFNPDFVAGEEASLGCLPPKLLNTMEINLYIQKVVEQQGNDAAGIELSYYSALKVFELLDGPVDASIFSAAFYLRRRDIVAQGISLYRSATSGFFHSYQTDSDAQARFAGMEYDAEAIKHYIEHLLECELGFERMFADYGIAPLRVYYEDLVAAPGYVLSIMSKLLGTRVERYCIKSSLKKVSDSKNSLWASRFEKDNPSWVEAFSSTRPALYPSFIRTASGQPRRFLDASLNAAGK